MYVNQFGGQDELVFDGSSLAMNGNKEVVFEAPSWEENTSVVEFNVSAKKFNDLPFEKAQVSDLENIYMAMVIGLKDYVAKNNLAPIATHTSKLDKMLAEEHEAYFKLSTELNLIKK